mmetsp:Transcript_7588/g.16689  ORF Transcript_7588/g.16689 Transcript_7588/m.16689 type:complete len:428 (+) Transcript_7588:67-1350(+)
MVTRYYVLPLALLTVISVCNLVNGSIPPTVGEHDQHQDEDSELQVLSLRQVQASRFAASSLGVANIEPSAAGEGGSSVLCSRNKWLPELYVLGAPKAATTALAWELVQNGIPSSATITSFKFNQTFNGVDPVFQASKGESGFLEYKESYFVFEWVLDHHIRWDPAAAKEDWFEGMPACPDGTDRKLFADYNPGSLSLAGNADTLGGVGSLLGVEATSIKLPAWLQSLYGPLSARLTFVVMLREPLSALQSAWYHARAYKDVTGEDAITILGVPTAQSFIEQLHETIGQAEAGHVSEWVWHVAYGTQVRDYLSAFAAAQFVFCPMLYFFQNPADLSGSLQDRLGFPLSNQRIAPDALNDHPHPDLNVEVPPTSSTRARFDALMARDRQLLLEQLLYAHIHGARMPELPPYPGSTTIADVEEWLVAGWG